MAVGWSISYVGGAADDNGVDPHMTMWVWHRSRRSWRTCEQGDTYVGVGDGGAFTVGKVRRLPSRGAMSRSYWKRYVPEVKTKDLQKQNFWKKYTHICMFACLYFEQSVCPQADWETPMSWVCAIFIFYFRSYFLCYRTYDQELIHPYIHTYMYMSISKFIRHILVFVMVRTFRLQQWHEARCKNGMNPIVWHSQRWCQSLFKCQRP